MYAHLFYKLSVFIKNYTYRKREREKEEVSEALGTFAMFKLQIWTDIDTEN
jgi:hypothetical protein